MNDPLKLTEYEHALLVRYGWVLNGTGGIEAADAFAYIPNDYDGCSAYGAAVIQQLLRSLEEHEEQAFQALIEENIAQRGQTP